MARSEIICINCELPNDKKVKVRACYKKATKKGKPFWKAAPQDGDLVFVINKGGIPKIGRGKGRSPYAIYPDYDRRPVDEVISALAKDAARAGIQYPKTAAKNDLEWDGGIRTGMESGTPLPDTRDWVRHPLADEKKRTYLIIGKIIKP